MDIHKCITLDVNEGTSRQIVNCKPNDNGKRLVISLNASGRPYFVDDDVRAVVCGTRPDGFTFLNNAQIVDGRVNYTLTEQNTGAVGTVRAELRLYKDEQLIASPTFIIEVAASAMDDGEVIESAEATALTQLIHEADAAIKATEASVIRAAEVSVDNGVGEPAATVELIPGADGQTVKMSFSNIKGEKGDKGETGETGPVGPVGPQGERGIQGERGPQGIPGDTGPTGPQGATGPAGADGKSIFALHANPDSDLIGALYSMIDNGDRPIQKGDLLVSLTNGRVYSVIAVDSDQVTAEYTGLTVKGEKGATGPAGADGAPGEDGAPGKDGADGAPGADGYSPTIDVSKTGKTTTLTITDKNGTKTAEILDGADGTGGGGIDELLDDDGKIKPEFLPESDTKIVMLPETTLVFSEDIEAFVIESGIDTPRFTIGESYTITYNGTDYECEAIDGSVVDAVGFYLFGNFDAIAGTGDNGIPFVLIVIPAEMQADAGAAAQLMSLDGAESVTLSISGLSEDNTFFNIVYRGGIDQSGEVAVSLCNKGYSDIATAYMAKKPFNAYLDFQSATSDVMGIVPLQGCGFTNGDTAAFSGMLVSEGMYWQFFIYHTADDSCSGELKVMSFK